MSTGGRLRHVAAVVWLPATLAVLAVVEMAALRPDRWQTAAAVEVGACVALCGRRRFVLASPMLALAAVVLIPVLGTPLDVPAMPVALSAFAFFSLGRYVGDRRAALGFVLILMGVWADYRWFDSRAHSIADVVFVLVLAVPPFVLGLLLRRLAEQKAVLESTQELVRAQAVRDERDRIARELHDVIAHSVSAMVVQTAAAQDLVRSDPVRAEAVLADVADTGRRALAETGRLLHVIRDSDDELGLTPTPGLAQVPELVDRFRAEGLTVDLDLVQPVPALPAGVDVSTYRIVQEALTNALRYGADRDASLSIACTEREVRIETSNAIARADGVGSGLGLLGMAERVAVLGGTFSHGVSPAGRFELAATLPVSQ
ncbi:MAG TPA: histidine kinase [Cellulomonas sp.]|nr:histidine kinase [Cellulomonas sp.]